MYLRMYVCIIIIIIIIIIIFIIISIITVILHFFFYLCFRSYEPAFRVHETCEYPPLKPHHSRVISFESD